MTYGTMECAALVVAAGILLFTSAPSRAATDDTGAKTTQAASEPIALTKTTKSKVSSSKSRAAKYAALKAAKKAALDAKRSKIKAAAAKEKQLSTAVANANAMMTGNDTRGGAEITGSAPLEAAAADQLTELGRSLTAPPTDDEPRRIATQLVLNDQPQSAMPPSAVPMASAEPLPAVTQVRSGPSGDPWAQSSLVGKLFIAVGGMLTLASAARMLVA